MTDRGTQAPRRFLVAFTHSHGLGGVEKVVTIVELEEDSPTAAVASARRRLNFFDFPTETRVMPLEREIAHA